MFRALVVGASFLLCLPATPALAGHLVDLEVVSRASGSALPMHWSQGRGYVVGTPEERFSVRLTNRSAGRVLVVLSVDGVNAVTGQDAAAGQSGYVLNAHESAEITGWRKNMQEVARFYFTSLADSYAGRTGRPDNVGVIGVAAYREMPVPLVRRYVPAPSTTDPLPSRSRSEDSAMASKSTAGAPARPAQESLPAAPESRLGTGHGELESSVITSTQFRPATSSPEEVVSVWYDSRERLASRGILPRRVPCCQEPQPFPGPFVPDPRG